MAELPRVMTPGMVAEVWHCSERHVRNLIAAGELPSFRAGGKLIRVFGKDVEAYECRNRASSEIEPAKPATEKAEAVVTRLSALDRARLHNVRRKFSQS